MTNAEQKTDQDHFRDWLYRTYPDPKDYSFASEAGRKYRDSLLAERLYDRLPKDGDFWFVTLTMKQGLLTRHGHIAKITEEAASDNVRWFLKNLNRKIFGHAYKKYGKKLIVIDCSEGGGSTLIRVHRHLIIAKPTWLPEDKFERLIRQHWRLSRWGHHLIEVDRAKNLKGCIAYISKTGSDAIQLDTTHIPIPT
jgi:hypothetical protein